MAAVIDADAPIDLRPIARLPHVAKHEADRPILSADGQVLSEMRAGDHITVRRSRRTVRLMHLAGSSFCETLRRKLHWRGTPL